MKIGRFAVLSLIAFLLLPSASFAQSTGSSYQFNQNLTIGSTGPDVIALQQVLINDGFLTAVSSPTGYFGMGTQTALAKFQAANGISPASGYAGPKTRAFLDTLNVSSSAGSSSSVGNNDESTSASSGNSGSTLSSMLINEIEPDVVEVNCYPGNFATSGEYVSGSGTSVKLNGGITYIETNYHVLGEANTGGGTPTCYAVYPQQPDFTYNGSYGDYQLTLYGYHYDPDTYEDSAIFTLGPVVVSSTPLSSVPVINSLPLTGISNGCSAAEVGDSVTVFGYPSSGNLLGISETVTQGTIAGILPGPIYKFDGAIDHGNSGGLAILDKNSCVLGIPTLGDSGLTAGIGYIQSFNLADTPVSETNDQVCQNQYGGNSIYSGTNNSQGGPICGCASGYQWNSDQSACVSAETGYEVCSSAYSNETWDGTYSSAGKYNCVCDSGYVMNSTETGCVLQPSCPTFSTYNSNTNSCQCLPGYISNGNSCESAITYCENLDGYGATYDYGTNSCACAAGFVSSGGQCVLPSTVCERDVGAGSYYLGYDNPNGTLACSDPYDY